MIINERKSSNFKINTDMIKYDVMMNPSYENSKFNTKHSIEWMTPENYVRECAKIFGVDFKYLYDDRLDNTSYKYNKLMKQGSVFPMPMINYSSNNQEGLHRAIASMMIDPDALIPVLVIKKMNNEREG